MNKRGVYFFVIDAFIGASIVVVSLLVILSSYESTREVEQPFIILEDFMTYLQQTQVRDFQGNYTRTLIANGNITDTSNTLFEQIAEFHYRGDPAYQGFIKELVDAALPSQMNLEYYYDDQLLYQRTVFPLSPSGLSLSSKKVALTTIDNTVIYGPHIVEVIMWTS